MKIYTKKGDAGVTSLFGGKRLPKDHIRIDSYGTVDELNSYIGLVHSLIGDETQRTVLREIQDRLFTIGSHLASDPDQQMITPDLKEENQMDNMNEVLPVLKHFVLPGGHPAVAHCHVARCVCRRAERIVVALQHTEPVEGIIICYLNRLSDYLFVLSRFIAHILGAEELRWMPRK